MRLQMRMRVRMSIRNSECFKCFSAESQAEVRIYNKRPNRNAHTTYRRRINCLFTRSFAMPFFCNAFLKLTLAAALATAAATTSPALARSCCCCFPAATALASALSTVTVASSSVAAIRVTVWSSLIGSWIGKRVKKKKGGFHYIFISMTFVS